jgi:hypothetical protein
MVFNMTATRFMPRQETPGAHKKRPFRSLFHAQDTISSGLVYDFLDGILGFANGLLGFALTLLQGALNLKVRIAHGFAGALFDRADGLVSHALDLVGSAAHDWSPDELMAARSPSTACNQRIGSVLVALKMISVEKSLMKTHHCAGLARTGQVAKAASQREFSVAKFSASNIR